MIPRLDLRDNLPVLTAEFLRQLEAGAYAGEVRSDYGSRLAVATDNSVYQLIPQAVLLPRSRFDLVQILRLANEPDFHAITFAPRGGGTGTNGGSIGDGICIDVSKYMNRILEIDLDHGWVRVEPGVVLDQLNRALEPHGVFFAPNVAPSDRATIGGMISNDSCGQGSRLYGRTSQHIVSLTTVLMAGKVWESSPLTGDELARVRERADSIGAVHRIVDDVVTGHADAIAERFPNLRRFLTGYDLAHVYDERGLFNLNAVLAGSEGTLGLIAEAVLRLTPIPRHKRLFAIHYASFDDALAAARDLLALDPSAIETIDETILSLARDDVVWRSVEKFLRTENGEPPRATNLVELTDSDAAALETRVREAVQALGSSADSGPIGYYVAHDQAEADALWTLRKRGAALLGSTPGRRRPIPFVEDTAVPPELLADFIREFRSILDEYDLTYGFYGHVDVGCLHVRPALDMRDPDDEVILRRISDRVGRLVERYGGVLWCEHGKGLRSSFNPQIFGDELYAQLQRIKQAFDPHNQLNPGKVATPRDSDAVLATLDAPKRGWFDREIGKAATTKFEGSIACNGNGACFNWDPGNVMCPSSKITRDRIHSPKGRAAVLREWLRQLSLEDFDIAQPSNLDFALSRRLLRTINGARDADDFSHEVYRAMDGCLACKACTTQCPLHVDIPRYKSDFLRLYHERYARPPGDHLIGRMETLVPWMARAPRLTNAVLASPLTGSVLSSVFGLREIPPLAGLNATSATIARDRTFDRRRADSLDEEQRQKSVILVQDVFTSFYEPKVLDAAIDLLERFDRRVFILPYFPSGKALHVKGFLDAFAETARYAAGRLSEAASAGIPLVGLEPAVTLLYRDEYRDILGDESGDFEVRLIQEFLDANGPPLRPPPAPRARESRPLTLLRHCTEDTAAAASTAQWIRVFEACGLSLQAPNVGCCGMCGAFGHEVRHYEESKGIFDLSWQMHVEQPRRREDILCTGHSCRTQTQRFAGFTPLHPVEALLAHLDDPSRMRND
jgi:FAD/FMN-containing dehydrogenase/Fe-S oxidoreductase